MCGPAPTEPCSLNIGDSAAHCVQRMNSSFVVGSYGPTSKKPPMSVVNP